MRWSNNRILAFVGVDSAKPGVIDRLFGSAKDASVIQPQPSPSKTEWDGPGYRQTLDQARNAFRRDALEEVEHVLMRAGMIAGDDPAYHNLLGILYECRGRKRQARKAYGRAIRANSNYAPAQQNMRRLYELATFGRTWQPVALGDEPVTSSQP